MDKILARIRKLAALAADAGATEAEAALAATKMAQLLAEHNLSQDEALLRSTAGECVKGTFEALDIFGREWCQVAVGIAVLCDCKVWRSRNLDMADFGIDDKVSVSFFGFPTDVEAAKALTAIAFKAIITESAKAFKPFSPKAEAFMAGMASRLAERITAMKPPVPTGKGLMVIKNQLIEREFDKLGLNLGRAPKGNFSAAAYAQGKASAEGVALGGAKALGPRPLAISYRT